MNEISGLHKGKNVCGRNRKDRAENGRGRGDGESHFWNSMQCCSQIAEGVREVALLWCVEPDDSEQGRSDPLVLTALALSNLIAHSSQNFHNPQWSEHGRREGSMEGTGSMLGRAWALCDEY